MRPYRFLFAYLAMLAAAALCSGQNVTPARSGTLHYVIGDVLLDDEAVVQKTSVYPLVKPGSLLQTRRGKAEVLLTPGVFLRLDENTAIRMLDADLAHTRVELVSGAAMLEADDPKMSVKNAPVTVVAGDTEVQMVKHGLVEISLEAGQVKVYKGQVEVASGPSHITVKDGRYSPLTGELRAEKFDSKIGSDLYLWSRDRSVDLSAANMYSAGAINGGSAFGYNSGTPWNGGWYYNSFFRMFTFVPATGTFWNPWGYGFYSPNTIVGYGGPQVDLAYPASRQIGRTLGGNPDAAATPSPITRQLGGGTGQPPALGSGMRGGSRGR